MLCCLFPTDVLAQEMKLVDRSIQGMCNAMDKRQLIMEKKINDLHALIKGK